METLFLIMFLLFEILRIIEFCLIIVKLLYGKSEHRNHSYHYQWKAFKSRKQFILCLFIPFYLWFVLIIELFDEQELK